MSVCSQRRLTFGSDVPTTLAVEDKLDVMIPKRRKSRGCKNFVFCEEYLYSTSYVVFFGT